MFISIHLISYILVHLGKVRGPTTLGLALIKGKKWQLRTLLSFYFDSARVYLHCHINIHSVATCLLHEIQAAGLHSVENRVIVKNGVKFAVDLALPAAEGQSGNLREPHCHRWTVAHLFITTAATAKHTKYVYTTLIRSGILQPCTSTLNINRYCKAHNKHAVILPLCGAFSQ